jgi:folylpolyglutamate synthase/dihydropteroate synthase
MNLSTGDILAKRIHNNEVSRLDTTDFFSQNNGMARPLKEKGQRKDSDLRIPLTGEQKQLIVLAAQIEAVEMATWARPILLEAARKRIDASNKQVI